MHHAPCPIHFRHCLQALAGESTSELCSCLTMLSCVPAHTLILQQATLAQSWHRWLVSHARYHPRSATRPALGGFLQPTESVLLQMNVSVQLRQAQGSRI